MSIFTRTAADPAPRPPSADLPAGYDNPESEWFVRPDLRPFYYRDLAAEAEALAVADGGPRQWLEAYLALAEYERRAAAEDRNDPTARAYERDYPRNLNRSQRIRAIIGSARYSTPDLTLSEDLTQLYLHQTVRLPRAARAKTDEDARQQRAEVRQVTHVCEVCREVAAVTVPKVPAPQDRRRNVRACPPCQTALRLAHDEQLAAQRVGEHTRRDLARDWLTQR